MLTEKIKEYIREHAENNSSEECCGVIIENLEGKLEAFSCLNLAEDKREKFEVCHRGYLKASTQGKIVAFYHSHISNNSFGLVDKHYSNAFCLPLILYKIPSQSFEIYFPRIENQYVGREFKIGESDCFTLVRDYYRQELKINIRDYPRDAEWYEKKPNLISENFTNEGFFEVSTLKEHDVLLFRMRGEAPSHIGIYLGGQRFLHQPRSHSSLIEHYGLPYKHRTTHILRYGTI